VLINIPVKTILDKPLLIPFRFPFYAGRAAYQSCSTILELRYRVNFCRQGFVPTR